MKRKTLWIRVTAVIFGLLLTAFGVIGVFAEDVPEVPAEEVVTDAPVYTDPPTDPIYTDPPTELPTEAPTEPPTEAPTEATSQPAETTAAPQQPTTEASTDNGGGFINFDPQTTDFVPPTIPKTVSEKSYTTNYAAGVISWICVIVGLIVIFAVAASTKLSGIRARRRT